MRYGHADLYDAIESFLPSEDDDWFEDGMDELDDPE